MIILKVVEGIIILVFLTDMLIEYRYSFGFIPNLGFGMAVKLVGRSALCLIFIKEIIRLAIFTWNLCKQL